MPDDRLNERDLDRFWNDLVAGLPATERGDLDPAAIDAIQAFQAHAATSPPESARQRVGADLDAEIDRLERTRSANGRAPTGPFDARLDPGQGRRSRRRMVVPVPPLAGARRWTFAQVAVAALLLLAIGLGALALGRGWWSGPERRNTIPAAVAPATPPPTSSGITEQILVEVAIPAEALPVGAASSSLAHFTLLPGARTTWTVFQNAHLVYVLTGALAVHPDGSVHVRRAAGNGAWEKLPVGTEVALGPGDAMLLLNAARTGFDNVGADPVELVYWGIVTGSTSTPPMPPEWVTHNYDLSGAGAVSLPGGPGLLRLRRVEIEPRAVLAAPPAVIVHFGVTLPTDAAGTPVPVNSMVRQTDGAIVNVMHQVPITVYALTLVPADGGAGTPIAASPPP